MNIHTRRKWNGSTHRHPFAGAPPAGAVRHSQPTTPRALEVVVMAIGSGTNHGISTGVASFHEVFSPNTIYTMELEEDVELQRLYTWEHSF